MGYYINKTSDGKALPARGKVAALIADGAQIIDLPFVWEEDIVCVVDNGLFEAAGYAYNQDELDAFAEPDGRRRTWLRYKHAKQQSGYTKT